jgi:fructose-bisphosphate aldolase class I
MEAMTPDATIATARALMADGKGLLAMDESIGTCNRRLSQAGIPATPQARRAWRELLLTTPGLGASIGGAILFDETLHQRTSGGTPFVDVLREAGIAIGIKVDTGTTDLAAHPGEHVTEGLDGLRERLRAYHAAGARFAKWRGVFALDATADGPRPSSGCLAANAVALARYAALCLEAGLVPIVEPEVLMDGTHDGARCGEATEAVLRAVFGELVRQRVTLEAVVLKPNMVTAGTACPGGQTLEEVADATVRCLRRTVPAAVAGIAFLSGGQPGALATARLDAMQRRYGSTQARTLPWPLTFSFGRALQQPALALWAGRDEHRVEAQRALLHRAQCNAAALRGEYHAAMETT